MKIFRFDPLLSRDAERILENAGLSDRERIVSVLDSFPNNAFIAYSLGSPVGIACSEASEGRSRAEFCIFVVPKYRLRGYGTRLYCKLAEHAGTIGTKTLVCSLPNSSGHTDFLLKLGFKKKYSSKHMIFSGITPENVESFEKYDDSMFYDFVDAEAKSFLPVRLRTGTEPPMIQPTENVRSFLSKAAESYFVLRNDSGRIIAGAGCYNGEISDVFVDERYRGQGIGRKLVEKCIVFSRKNGFEPVRLSVVSDNEPAVSLYSSIGFKTDTIEDYYVKNIEKQ